MASHRRAIRAVTIHLGPPLPMASSTLPALARGSRTCPANRTPRTACACTRWGLPCPGRHRPGGALLPHPFTLTGPAEAALAVCFLWHYPWLDDHEPVDVIHHRILSCSDFPPSDKPTAVTCPQDNCTSSGYWCHDFHSNSNLFQGGR